MRHDERDGGWTVPALRPRDGGPATWFARRIGGPPAAVFAAALVLGFAVLAGLASLLGLLVVHVLAGPLGLGAPDNAVVRTLATHRTGTLTDLSAVGSAIGGAPVLPILVAVVAVAVVIRRHWRIAAFAVFVLTAESATYRVASLLVPRDRPHVHRLESLPSDASWPSGHTAASIAVYAGLALLLTSAVRDRRVRVAAWAVAAVIPVFVAGSRLYRGMHHPMDVLGGALIGLGAITLLVFACRAAGAAATARVRAAPPRHTSTAGMRLAP
jgi:undecaprenyl-diphosphatase